MTTQNSVSHMAYLLEPGCKRREVWQNQRARTGRVPNFFGGQICRQNTRNRLLY
jgi:hypothetical protein